MSEEVKGVKGVKKWAVGLVGRSWEQYAPYAVNSMQCGGRNLPSVLSDLWRKLAWGSCGVVILDGDWAGGWRRLRRLGDLP
jgi:hypothetical protein